MTTKFKILSAISFFALIIALTLVSVCALSNVEFKISGVLEYIAPQSTVKDVNEYPTLTFSVTDSNSKTMSVQANSSNQPTGDLEIPAMVLSGGEEYTITSIEYNAEESGDTGVTDGPVAAPDGPSDPSLGPDATPFEYCSELVSVTIPGTVTYIQTNAFKSCSSLKNVTFCEGITYIDNLFDMSFALQNISIPDSATHFIGLGYGNDNVQFNEYGNCKYLGNDINPYVVLVQASSTDITSCTINNSCKVIAYDAFSDCSALTNLSIPNSVTNIGGEAFYYCTGLTSVSIGTGVTCIGTNAFRNCKKLKTVTIPNSVKNIESNAFYDCTALTSVSIGGAISIGESAFYGCSTLASVTIPDSIISIGANAFSGCDNLTYKTDLYAKYLGNQTNSYVAVIGPLSTTSTSYNLNSKCKVIADSAFSDCTKVKTITIPNSVTSIGKNAFYNCTALNSISMGNGVTSIGVDAFYGCTNLGSHGINNVKYLGNSTNRYIVFIGVSSTSLTSLTLQSTCTVIYHGALMNNTSVKSITIPDSVKSIGDNAFNGCTGLTSVTMPNSITNIGENAFYDCTSLTEVNVKATTVPTGGSGMFKTGSSSLIINVPSASVEAYKSASYWSAYSRIIKGKNF